MSFSQKIIQWYLLEHRDLPWRKTKDPYYIWLSEIILQQTKVAQGLPYYHAFVVSFPDIKSLAEAPIEKVLKLWQGLGYYSRGRNLHKAAKLIMSEYGGVFPADFKKLKALPGVGDYTAAAIASFAFDQPHAVVDGNVYRVLSRVWGITTPIDSSSGKIIFRDLAKKNLPSSDSAVYNQAIMEFGATQCTARNPDCGNCVLGNDCVAKLNNLVEILPEKTKKIVVRNRFFNYFLFINENEVFMAKRNEKDIWQGLFEPHLIETEAILSQSEAINALTQKTKFTENNLQSIVRFQTGKHQLTHQKIYSCLHLIKIYYKFELPNGKWYALEELNTLAVSVLVSNYFNLIKEKEKLWHH